MGDLPLPRRMVEGGRRTEKPLEDGGRGTRYGIV